MWYFKFSKVLVSVTSSLFFFCACHASAMDPRQKAGNDILEELKEIRGFLSYVNKQGKSVIDNNIRAELEKIEKLLCLLDGEERPVIEDVRAELIKFQNFIALQKYYEYLVEKFNSLVKKYGLLAQEYVSLKRDKLIPKQEDKLIPKQEDKPIPIPALLAKKVDKIVIEDSAKEELKKLGVGRVESLDSIPNVVVDLVFKYGVLAPVKKYLRMPSDYLTTIREKLEKCNSIRLLKHPKEKEGIILACDNEAIVFCSTGKCEKIEIK